MKRHPSFGLVAPELGWVPAPRYLLRRARVLHLARALAPGRLLEIGCGAGALLDDLASIGFDCDAVETSDVARRVASTLNAANDRVRIHPHPKPSWRAHFDLVVAFEVLEHIDDDTAALRRWCGWIKPGGHLLLSVPCHESRWGPTDVWAGHFRRYERPSFEQLLQTVGLEVIRTECYGFPLANLVDPVRSRLHARQLAKSARGRAAADDDFADRTARSGIQRTAEGKLFPLLANRLGTFLMEGAIRAQRLFLEREMGNGYLALARLPGCST